MNSHFYGGGFGGAFVSPPRLSQVRKNWKQPRSWPRKQRPGYERTHQKFGTWGSDNYGEVIIYIIIYIIYIYIIIYIYNMYVCLTGLYNITGL